MTLTRPYERTHPWLTFKFDLTRLRPTDWLALGRAVADCGHIADTPLDPSVAAEIHQLHLAKGVLATTAIEGNTLSEAEARAAIAGTLELPPSRAHLKRELDNIVAACNKLVARLRTTNRLPLTVATLGEMNASVLDGLEVEAHVAPGKVRTSNVTVGRYRCPEGRDARFLLDRLCSTLTNMPTPDMDPTAFAILKAIFAHVYLVWIHPFGDGNGRTGRLLELAILLEAGLPQPVCHLLSNHYNQTRPTYYRQLARASQADDGLFGFVTYALAGFIDGLQEHKRLIREHQWQVAWIHFVHESFRRARGATDRRQRALVLALSSCEAPVSVDDVPDLGAEMARAYAGLSRRTLMRDVESLRQRGLLRVTPEGLAVRRERVLQRRPWRHEAVDE